MARRDRVGITDVAAKAGVSVTTVSHVLSSRRPVSEATRAKVLAVIEELDYRPNELARSMRARRTHTVGVIVPDITNPFYTAAFRGLQEAVAPAGYHCIVTSTDAERSVERDVVRQMLTRVDGIVMSGADKRLEDVQPVVDAGVPLVLLGADLTGGFDVVTNADEESGAVAAEYLVGRGYRRIAFLSTESEPAARRLAGYREVVSPPEELIVPVAESLEGGARGMATLAGLAEPPDAVICGNDVMAIGAMYEAADRGLRVPDDIAVMGFDDIDAAALVSPRLTTMATASREHGQVAGEMLLRRMNDDGAGEPRRVVFPAKLIARDSA
ncbi:LacI family transcriptional regulator [Stackebrandtia albiflava]|uniref:LacI family transcriptional regulator n=1 Tax=Stackebrandtia albiflava TaxID=406432 RepID=A0A562UR28_9ACTN|nr:LacI family DNA-binding transcriptional regulator [Stackebrandtia albiflava]TWJ08067.1 LacI family transcriptional regulator [Stackebrandtia albiflava]